MKKAQLPFPWPQILGTKHLVVSGQALCVSISSTIYIYIIYTSPDSLGLPSRIASMEDLVMTCHTIQTSLCCTSGRGLFFTMVQNRLSVYDAP